MKYDKHNGIIETNAIIIKIKIRKYFSMVNNSFFIVLIFKQAQFQIPIWRMF